MQKNSIALQPVKEYSPVGEPLGGPGAHIDLSEDSIDPEFLERVRIETDLENGSA